MPPSLTCPHCGRTSYNVNDLTNRYCGWCHVFLDDAPGVTTPGRYYGRTDTGQLEAAPPGRPDAVICRRVVDFPGRQVPTGGAVGTCGECGAAVVFNPAGPHQDQPRICMQCASIRPLPITRPT
jgi:hypothetical protein